MTRAVTVDDNVVTIPWRGAVSPKSTEGMRANARHAASCELPGVLPLMSTQLVAEGNGSHWSPASYSID